jgi:L-lactate dehydrogenase complex protein LldF
VDALPYASSLCGACRDACPAKIDLPKLLLDLRRDVVDAGDTARLERMGMQGFLWAMGSRARYQSLGGAASFGSNLLAWLSGGQIKALPGPFAGWTDSRNFPPFAKRPFREQFAERQRRRKTVG